MSGLNKLTCTLGAAVIGSCAIQGAVVLTVDVSTPAVVVITATGASPSTTVSSDVFNGFTLSGFFTSDASGSWAGSALAAGLKGGNATIDYDTAQVDEASSVGLFLGGGSQPISFSIGSPAFTGSSAFDLSGASLLLPGAGSSGSLIVWDGAFNPVEIGTWQITPVPEPSAYAAVMGVSLIGFSAYNRFKKQSKC